jgi:alpha-ketoglutaric semialdehyde dehydrogenase
MTLTGRQTIGAALAACGDRTFHAVDPRTGEALPPAVHEGTPQDVDRAAKLARHDFDAFRGSSNEQRVRGVRYPG